MNDARNAYLAGIIDGEGCVGLRTRQQRYVTPSVQITNTDRNFIYWLREHVGGGSIYAMKDKRPTRKPVFMWSCHGEIARALLRDVRPYLRIKAQQADVILSLGREYEDGTDSLGRPTRRITQQQLQRNADARERIRVLNQRGVTAS